MVISRKYFSRKYTKMKVNLEKNIYSKDKYNLKSDISLE